MRHDSASITSSLAARRGFEATSPFSRAKQRRLSFLIIISLGRMEQVRRGIAENSIFLFFFLLLLLLLLLFCFIFTKMLREPDLFFPPRCFASNLRLVSSSFSFDVSQKYVVNGRNSLAGEKLSVELGTVLFC